MHLKEGRELQNGKYKIIRVLGQGGFGITYLAKHTILNKDVAIKEFFPKKYCGRDNRYNLTIGINNNTENNNTDIVENLKKRFLKEAQNIARLEHDAIIKIHDIYEENNTAYYVMDYLDGENLNEMVKQNGPLSESKALEYISKVGEALEYIHSQNMIHFDVKPANIIIRKRDDSPILIDFGLSKQYDNHGDATSTLLRGISHGYSPIEMYSGDNITFSPQVDVYSLAATLYYLLEGKTPPQATDLTFQRTIKTNVINEIRKGMSLDKNKRHTTVGQFVASFIKQNDDEDTVVVGGVNVDVQQPNSRRLQGKRLWAAIFVVFIISICCILVCYNLEKNTGKPGGGTESDSINPDSVSNKPDSINPDSVSIKFDSIYPYSEGLARVLKDSLYGFIDENGKIAIPLKYDDAIGFSNGFAKVKQNGKYGIINTEGNVIIPLEYEIVGVFSEGLARVKQAGKWGFFDESGNVAIQFIYEYAGFFSEGLAVVAKRDKSKKDGWSDGFIDKSGKVVIPFIYDNVGNFSEGLASVKQNGKWGFIDKTGNVVIQFLYDNAYDFSNGVAKVKQNGKEFYINKKGERL